MEVTFTKTGSQHWYGWNVTCESLDTVGAVLGIEPRDGVIWVPGWAGYKAVYLLRYAGFTVADGWND